MPQTIQYNEGDGVTDDHIAATIQLPDDQSTIIVDGSLTIAGQAAVLIPKVSLASPTTPGSGSVYYIIQVDPSNNGVATIKQSSSAIPLADTRSDATGPQRVIFTQTLVSGTPADDALAGGDTIPEPAVGQA